MCSLLLTIFVTFLRTCSRMFMSCLYWWVQSGMQYSRRSLMRVDWSGDEKSAPLICCWPQLFWCSPSCDCLARMQVHISSSYQGLSTWSCTSWGSYWPISQGWQGPSGWQPFPENYHSFHASTTADRRFFPSFWYKSAKVEDIHNASVNTHSCFFIIQRIPTAWLKVWKTSSIQEKVIYFIQKENVSLTCIEYQVFQRDRISQDYVGNLHDWAMGTRPVCSLIWSRIKRVFVIEIVIY